MLYMENSSFTLYMNLLKMDQYYMFQMRNQYNSFWKAYYGYIIFIWKSTILSAFREKETNVKFCVQSEWWVLHVGSHFVPVCCQFKEPMCGVDQDFGKSLNW